MIKTFYFCDWCNSNVESSRDLTKLIFTHNKNRLIEKEKHSICEKCFKNIVRLIHVEIEKVKLNNAKEGALTIKEIDTRR